MARAALIAWLSLVSASCGAAPIGRGIPFALGDDWTETPLDAELARLACDSADCAEVCRVTAHVVEPSGATREVEQRIRSGSRVVITLRSDGSMSLRASVERDEERLDAMLELPHRGALDADAAIRALAHPRSSALPEDAHVVRTYELAGATSYVLQEAGAGRRTARHERYEELDGVVQQGRATTPGRVSATRATIDGRTRTTESVHEWEHCRMTRGGRCLGREQRRSETTTQEELDARGRVVRIVAGDEPSELEYGDGELPIAITRTWQGEPRRAELRDRTASALEIERDAEGRVIRYHSSEPGRGERVEITRDADGRVLTLEAVWAQSGFSLRVTRDAEGRLLHATSTETIASATSTSTYERALDAGGRVLRVEATSSYAPAGEPEVVVSTSASYAYGDACAPEVAVEDEIELQPPLDDRADLAPF